MTDASSWIDLYFIYRVTDPVGFEEYLASVIPVTQAQEPYVLEYSLARDDDGLVLQHERYEDEDAIRKHLEVTAEGQKAWNASTELLDIRFVGPLSNAFREKWQGDGSSWWTPFRAVER